MENKAQKNMQAIEGDKLNPSKEKPLAQKSMEEITGRDSAAEHINRVIYHYPDATKKIDNPNSLANIFKRILKR